jgi:hypothetical protein
MGHWVLEILVASEWERCGFDSEIEAHTTYAAVLSDYKDKVMRAHLVTPKGTIERLKRHDNGSFRSIGRSPESVPGGLVG